MNETNNAVRKTVYLDEELTKRCEILFGEADVSSFSQFVTKALETYIDRLICENHSPFLTEELSKAIMSGLANSLVILSVSVQSRKSKKE